jgi:hypothetical protein
MAKVMKNQSINVKGTEIALYRANADDYISLTDMAKHKNPHQTALVISHWLSTRYTVEFMGVWERSNNPDFNTTEFRSIRNETGGNGYILTTKQWVEKTNAIGIRSKAGRYGGTYAHSDIAFEFATWISPEFKYYLISEFKRLKSAEQQQLSLEWDLQRTISKINYRIHTDAIKEHIIPPMVTKQQAKTIYASEADMLNVALFGKTAAEWRGAYPTAKGNIRDEATLEQLIVLSNMESINVLLIEQNLAQSERLVHLNHVAITQMTSLFRNTQVRQLEDDRGGGL